MKIFISFAVLYVLQALSLGKPAAGEQVTSRLKRAGGRLKQNQARKSLGLAGVVDTVKRTVSGARKRIAGKRVAQARAGAKKKLPTPAQSAAQARREIGRPLNNGIQTGRATTQRGRGPLFP